MILLVAMNITGMGVIGGDRSDSYADIDYLGHVGGAMGGLFYGLAFFPRAPTVSGAKTRMAGMFLFGLFFIMFGLLFYLNYDNM